jgi:hypothetical protein
VTVNTNGMIGANPEQLRILATEFERAANDIDAEIRVTTTSVRNTPWKGATADRFRQSWTSVHTTRLRSLSAQLRDAARSLRENAEDQERVSNAGVGTAVYPSGVAGAAVGAIWTKEALEGLAEDVFELLKWAERANGLNEVAWLLKSITRLNELPLFRIRGLPVVSVIMDGGEAVFWLASEGIHDARTWAPLANLGLTAGAAGVAVAMFGATAVAPATVALGAGMLIGDVIDHGVGWATGEKLSDRWADAALGTAATERRMDSLEVTKGMSAAEMQARADAQAKVAAEVHKKTEKAKTPWGALEMMFSI